MTLDAEGGVRIPALHLTEFRRLAPIAFLARWPQTTDDHAENAVSGQVAVPAGGEAAGGVVAEDEQASASP